MSTKLAPFVRPLKELERKLLSGSLKREQERLRLLPKRIITFTITIFGGIWVISFVVDHRLPFLMNVYLLVAAVAVLLWSYLPVKRKQVVCVERLNDALGRNEVHEIRIQAQAMVEFEEERR